MDFLNCPSEIVWLERQKWFESLNEKYCNRGSYLVSEQACALFMETECVFCAGAWLAVIILVIAVVDSQLRETELPGFTGNTYQLFKAIKIDSRLDAIRKRRNELIHFSDSYPAITVDQQWENRKELEEFACEAVDLMFQAFYLTPGV